MTNKVFILLFIFTLFSCRIDKDESDIAEEIKIAESVIYNFEQYSIKKGKLQYKIKAEKAESFLKDEITIIHNMEFSQYDKEKKLVATGKAKRVEYSMDSENALIDGEVEFVSITEGVTVSSIWLDWDNEKKILKGKEDVAVILQKKSGTTLEGKGFEAQIETKTISFSNGMQGVFVPEDDEEKNDE